jgi:hypothetical protein
MPLGVSGSSVRIVNVTGCPDISLYNDFTNDSVWTKAIGIYLGNPFFGSTLPGGQPLSVINSSIVEPTRLALDGVADNACAPSFFPCQWDKLEVGAQALIPFSVFGTCTTLTISGTFRQPTPLTFDPATSGLPYNPPVNWGIGATTDLQIGTDSGAINLGKTRTLFAQQNPTFGGAALMYYSHGGTPPAAPADFVDENWVQVVDLSARDPGFPDTFLSITFQCIIANEPFNAVGVAFFYHCAMAALAEVRNVQFVLTG